MSETIPGDVAFIAQYVAVPAGLWLAMLGMVGLAEVVRRRLWMVIIALLAAALGMALGWGLRQAAAASPWDDCIPLNYTEAVSTATINGGIATRYGPTVPSGRVYVYNAFAYYGSATATGFLRIELYNPGQVTLGSGPALTTWYTWVGEVTGAAGTAPFVNLYATSFSAASASIRYSGWDCPAYVTPTPSNTPAATATVPPTATVTQTPTSAPTSTPVPLGVSGEEVSGYMGWALPGLGGLMVLVVVGVVVRRLLTAGGAAVGALVLALLLADPASAQTATPVYCPPNDPSPKCDNPESWFSLYELSAVMVSGGLNLDDDWEYYGTGGTYFIANGPETRHETAQMSPVAANGASVSYGFGGGYGETGGLRLVGLSMDASTSTCNGVDYINVKLYGAYPDFDLLHDSSLQCGDYDRDWTETPVEDVHFVNITVNGNPGATVSYIVFQVDWNIEQDTPTPTATLSPTSGPTSTRTITPTPRSWGGRGNDGLCEPSTSGNSVTLAPSGVGESKAWRLPGALLYEGRSIRFDLDVLQNVGSIYAYLAYGEGATGDTWASAVASSVGYWRAHRTVSWAVPVTNTITLGLTCPSGNCNYRAQVTLLGSGSGACPTPIPSRTARSTTVPMTPTPYTAEVLATMVGVQSTSMPTQCIAWGVPTELYLGSGVALTPSVTGTIGITNTSGVGYRLCIEPVFVASVGVGGIDLMPYITTLAAAGVAVAVIAGFSRLRQ